MKTLLCIALAMIISSPAYATRLLLTGSPSWKITGPDCIFNLEGSIHSLDTTGTTSGTIKMVLWASSSLFPARGIAISEYTLGTLYSGQAFSDFTGRAPATVPRISGNYYFTILFMEYTSAGWATRNYTAAGNKLLEAGDFVTGSKWALPKKRVIAPPTSIRYNDRLMLTLKATEEFSQFSLDFQIRTRIRAVEDNLVKVAASGYTTPAKGKYSRKTVYYNDKQVKVGQLVMDYAAAAGMSVPWKSTLTLFFHSKTSGTYKNVEIFPAGGKTTWGIFTYTPVALR